MTTGTVRENATGRRIATTSGTNTTWRVYDGSGIPLTSDFGLPTSALGNRYLFQGREYSFATGLYYFRARHYDPQTGRWLSNDPIGISGGLNQYAFCANNPVMFVDPEGKVVWAVAKAAVTAWAKESLTTAVITGSVGAALGGIDMNGGKLGWSWSEAGAGFVAGFAGGFVEGGLKPFSPYLGAIAGATTYQEVSNWMTGTELPSAACGLLFGTTGYWLNLSLERALAEGKWWAYVSGTGVQIVVEVLAEVFESMQEAACE